MNDECPYVSKSDLNYLRHKAELPLFFICVLINFLSIGILLTLTVYFEGFGTAYYIAIGYIIIRLFLDFGHNLSVTRLNSVKITVEQFSGTYKWVRTYAKALGLKKVPDVYVRQLGGEFNSFSSNFFFRNYIMISAEIFETNNEDAVKFFIAHEMAHVAYNHTKLWYNLSLLISRYIPFLYSAFARATVYSCDNVAKTLCPQGVKGIYVLLVGNKLCHKIDEYNYIKQCLMTKGWFEFYANVISNQPLPTRRIPALYGITGQRIF